MGFIFTSLLCAIMCAISICYKKNNRKNFVKVFTSIALIFFIPIPFILLISWDSYLDLHILRATHENNVAALTTYTDRATPHIFNATQTSVSGKEVTDIKYNEYQASLKELIIHTRDIANRYNSKLSSKKIVKKSFMFGALIVAPDEDMRPLRL